MSPSHALAQPEVWDAWCAAAGQPEVSGLGDLAAGDDGLTLHPPYLPPARFVDSVVLASLASSCWNLLQFGSPLTWDVCPLLICFQSCNCQPPPNTPLLIFIKKTK